MTSVLTAIIINKVLAIYVGPSGRSIKRFCSNGAISQGIVKYTAEYETIEVFSTSIIISLVCSVFCL